MLSFVQASLLYDKSLFRIDSISVTRLLCNQQVNFFLGGFLKSLNKYNVKRV